MELKDTVLGSQTFRISPNASVVEALVAIAENKIDFVIVDRADKTGAYGIISRWHIVVEPQAEGEPSADIPAPSCALKPGLMMDNLDLDIRYGAKKMANENVFRDMEFEGEIFPGAVSDVDLLRAIAADGMASIMR